MGRELVKNRITKYDEQQKRKLVELGQSKKSYSNILAYLDGEIKQSTQMCKFNYNILCFKNDGVYQLNKAIEEIYGVSSGKAEKTMSGEGNLETLDIKLADGTRMKVPFGNIALPEAGEGAQIKINYDWGLAQLQLFIFHTAGVEKLLQRQTAFTMPLFNLGGGGVVGFYISPMVFYSLGVKPCTGFFARSSCRITNK